MPRGRFTIDEVLRQVLADSDSEEENVELVSEDDTVTSDGESPRHSPQALHNMTGASSQFGPVKNFAKLSPSRGRGRGVIGAQNTANIGECSGDENRGCGRHGRSRGTKRPANSGDDGAHRRTTNHAGNDNNDDGWEFLRGEEEYLNWIRNFDEPVGYCGDDLKSSEPNDFISLFLNDEFWILITRETNRYAHQILGLDILKPNSRFHDWYDVTVPEMKAFMSLHLCMGLVEKSEIEDYWAGFWPTYTPGFGKVMSRNRFENILSFLHFVNNDDRIERGQPGYDRLFKVRPIIDLIIPRFASVYGPRKELSLDEMTIAFRGRSTLKIYNPKKPDKYGYKAFVLSEASSGYVLQWSIYTGKNTSNEENVGATHHIVRQLLEQHIGKGHEVYMDSYYTSPALARELADKDTGLCGTVNCNRRGMPKELKPAQLPLRRGDDPVFMRQEKLLACAWHDTKRLTLLSTIHGNTVTQKEIRTKESVTGFRQIMKPVCVDSYNSFMGGVDTSDQRMKTYLFPHRSRKWYNRIFDAILSISVVNAHIIYTRCGPGPHKPLKAFIQDIITSWLEGFSKKETKKGGRPSMQYGEMPQRLTERHWLCNTDERPDCVVCSDRTRPKGRRQTQFRCRQCGVGLCAVPCNERYHTLKKYKQCHLDQ